jgi:hypothetical protein
MLCLRSFSIVDLFLSFEVHTDETLLAGRKELKRFEHLMKVRKHFCDSMMLIFPRTIFDYLRNRWRLRES